jgi:hypothetical protein
VVSVEVAGPQESSDGSAEIISDREIGAMIAMGFDVGVRGGSGRDCKYFDVWKKA